MPSTRNMCVIIQKLRTHIILKNNKGKTALMLASEKGHKDIVELIKFSIKKSHIEEWKGGIRKNKTRRQRKY